MSTTELVALHPAAWRAATVHPFLEGVRDGSLPAAAFQAWLVQDHIYVLDLVRFQAGLVRVAPREALQVLAGGLVALEAELSWFEHHAMRLGLRLDGDRAQATAAYRDHLEACAGSWPAGITSLWTGERAYLEAWSGIAPVARQYREFVEHWTVPEFATYVADLASLADAAGPDEAAFLAVCALESEFWGMAWASARS